MALMKEIMKLRFRMFRRKDGIFYFFDRDTGQRRTLGTADRAIAQRLIHAKNEGQQQPLINRQIARAYLSVSEPEIFKRTWQGVIDEIIKTKTGETRNRWETAAKDKAFTLLRNRLILETNSDFFLRVLGEGTVSTNVYLRRLHNFALDMNWLPWPVLAKRQWPKVRYKTKRAITFEEHEAIVAREQNPERKAFYQLAWHLGASQTDIAFLEGKNIDWDQGIVTYERRKTHTIALMRFDGEMANVMRSLPPSGPLFPYLRKVRAADRATEFKQRCKGLGIQGVTLHSYRYAWAERAKKAGYPERFAQEALGHNSKAIHRAYARNAQVILPSLESFAKHSTEQKILAFPVQGTETKGSAKQAAT
jgi:integrase